VSEASTSSEDEEKRSQPKVIIAGGGVGGLCLALALQAKGVPFTLYEKVKKYKPFGGPIQLQCNALATLEAIDMNVANEILNLGTITGDRVNGLLDGKTGEWYVRFDTRKPAKKDGLPLTLVLNRYVLLDILKNAIDPSNINLGKRVVSYNEQVDPTSGRKEVEVQFDDGTASTGDVVIAADGINSSIRKQMDPKVQDATYSGYTCYTATCDFELEDVEEIGYQVYLGYGQYFVASDVGGGQTQWYAFRKQDAGNPDTSNQVRENLLDMFEGWDANVVARLEASLEEQIEQRDIFDRKPVLSWVKGNAALIGDSAHAMQPNMGQGGCQAIEDAYVLAAELSRCNPSVLASTSSFSSSEGKEEGEEAASISIDQALKNYESKRCMRAAAIHGFARSAALMTTTWRPYIGSDPYDFYKYVPGAMAFWALMEKLKIPHPGKIAGQIAMMSTIDMILEYIACGNPVEEKDRVAYCQVPGVGVPKRNIPKNAFDMKGIPGFAK
jgi:zeaxanthin epoxidase